MASINLGVAREISSVAKRISTVQMILPISYAETDNGQHDDDHAHDQLEFLVLLLVLEA